jgi:hypothetical protein
VNEQTFQWPLSPEIFVRVTFYGSPVYAEDIEQMQTTLNVMKRALGPAPVSSAHVIAPDVQRVLDGAVSPEACPGPVGYDPDLHGEHPANCDCEGHGAVLLETVWIVVRKNSIDSVWMNSALAAARGAALDGEWEVQNYPLRGAVGACLAETCRAREREANLEKALREIVREAGFNASTPSLGIHDIGAIAAAALALA